MTGTGKIVEIWRYPVSSLGGEMLQAAAVGPDGIEGDRRYVLFDPATGSVAAPEKEARWRLALFLKANWHGDSASIGFLDGSWLDIFDPCLPEALGDHFGFNVAIGCCAAPEAGKRSLPQVSNRYGVAPLHVIATASLRYLAQVAPGTVADRRRFRPNLLVETQDEPGFVETHWLGKKLKLGTVETRVFESTKRCGMTLIAQPGLEEQADILRTIVRQNRRSLGVYCEIMRSGTIRQGEEILLGAEQMDCPTIL